MIDVMDELVAKTNADFCNPAHGGCGIHGFIRDGKQGIA